jgi:hypothetical protein
MSWLSKVTEHGCDCCCCSNCSLLFSLFEELGLLFSFSFSCFFSCSWIWNFYNITIGSSVNFNHVDLKTYLERISQYL